MSVAAGAIASIGAFAAAFAQEPSAVQQALASPHDSLLVRAVRERPADARAQLDRHIAQAGKASRPVADSILRLARRIARSYAAAWNDPFPVENLARFERMSAGERAIKVEADSLRLAGNRALGSDGVAAAMTLWREAFRRSLAVLDSASAAGALGNIGAGFYEDAQLDSAAAYLRRAREIATAIGDRRTALNAAGVLGNIAMERGELRSAEEILTRTLEERIRAGDVRGAVADHTNLGLISGELTNGRDARGHYGEALRLAREHELREGEATALLNLGNIASIEAEYAEAIGRYREALAIYRSLQNQRSAALVSHNLGLVATRRGDYRLARSSLMDALRAFTRAGTVEEQVQVRRDLATVEAARGQIQSGLEHLRMATRALAGAPKRYDLAAGIALAEADLGVHLNTYARADADYARAQALYQRAGDVSGEAEAMQGRAMLLLERKQYARALEQLRHVERVQRGVEDRRPAALTRLLIGLTQHEQGSDTAARLTLEEALDTLRALGDVAGQASAQVALAEIELDAGTPLAAEERYRQALTTLDKRAIPTLTWQIHAGLGRALRARGDLTGALTSFRNATIEIERMAAALTLGERRSTFLADKWDAYADLALLERDSGDGAAAFAVSARLRARQMLELLSRGRALPSLTADTALLARDHDLRRRIDELTRRLEEEEGAVSLLRGADLSNASSGVTREALARAQEQYAQLRLELRDGAGLGPVVPADVASWRSVATRLGREEALLAYLITDSTTVVFVLTADTIRVLDLGVSRRALATLVDFARGTMSRRQPARGSAAWRAPLQRLYRHLLAPIEDAGLLAGVRGLTIVPHAELHYLPFAALISGGETDGFLVERYDIAYAPSASTWMRLTDRASPEGRRIFALAPRSGDLPGSREEVDAIRRLYGRDATVLVGGEATEEAFRATVERYGIVHLATYGVLNQHNPLFSFVDLGRAGHDDGRLEVHEVFGLSLNAQLLVLSACQTALASGAVSDIPAGDDWVGLVRAFLGAGAQRVIATLWAVEDRSTAQVMERLHRGLRGGRSAVVALSEAQRATLRNSATSSPFYWAGFVLVGGR